MASEEVLAECRKLGETIRQEIRGARADIETLARSLHAAFLDLVSKEDLRRLESAIAYLERAVQNHSDQTQEA
jgi:BMFP domain-containing protein YqiC